MIMQTPRSLASAFCITLAAALGSIDAFADDAAGLAEDEDESLQPAEAQAGKPNTRLVQFLAPMAVGAAKSAVSSKLVKAAAGAVQDSLIDVMADMVKKGVSDQAGRLLDGGSANPQAAPPERVAAPVSAARPTVSPSKTSPAKQKPAASVVVPKAGIAYELFVVSPDSAPRLVSPNRHVFRNGERFYIRFMSNLPGRIDAFNVNPVGKQAHIGSWIVTGGEPVRLPERGNFRFVGDDRGTEVLQLQLRTCSTQGKRAITVEDDPPSVAGGCSDLQPGQFASSKRAIVVEEEGNTAIALADATSAQDLTAPVVVVIPLRHH